MEVEEVEMKLEIKTLTPLWTGGAKAGKVDRLHETGILGSLRWWYEVIVRGLGGKACDPSHGECLFDAEKYHKSKVTDERQRLRDAGLCDVCQVFGATGRRRRFRLIIVDNTKPDNSVQPEIKVRKDKHISTWYFPKNPNDKPRLGNLTLHIQSLDPAFPSAIIAGLIQFIADWAAVGARAQMGFGAIALANGRNDTQLFYNYVTSVAGNKEYPELPSLRNIFLARISPKEKGQVFTDQDTFNLKYDLRQLFSGQGNSDLRHFVMGTVKGERIAARIKMSRPYNDGREIRVWGWIPEQANVYRNNWNRDKVLQAIHGYLQQNYQLAVWREMNSVRDTKTQSNGDVMAFLRSLLAIEEEDDAA
jgi:CRISPR-associated protein Cmr1